MAGKINRRWINHLMGISKSLFKVTLSFLGASVWMSYAMAGGLSLGQLPAYDDLDLSGDGRHLLMVRSSGEVYDLVVRDLESAEERTLIQGGAYEGLINWCRWANQERIICSLRNYFPAPRLGQVARTRMVAINVDGSQRLDLIPRAKNRHRWPQVWNAQLQDRVISWLLDDPEHVLVQLNRDHPNRPSVFKLNIYDNGMSRILRPRSLVRRWYSTHEGNIRLAIGYEDESIPVIYRVNGRLLKRFDGPEFVSEIPPQPVGFSADERFVFMSMTNGRDRHGIYRVSMESGKVVDEIFHDPKFDVFGGVIMHPESGEPVGVSYLGHHPRLVWFDQRLDDLFAHIKEKLPGSQMQLISTDHGYSRFVLRTYGGIAPEHFLYNRQRDELISLGKDYPLLEDVEVVDLQPVEYDTRDGLTIPAYLAKPKHQGPYPTILLPHGGPYARDSAEFDEWTQFLVGSGFAVLKPNYRGSVGYGEAYMQAGYKQWGLKMQEDLMDGLDWLVQQNIADPDRVCVVGASYGGYTALVSAYKFADKISCAVSMAGISDLEETVQRIYSFDLVKRNRERIQDQSQLQENSPIRQVTAISVPILLMHGKRDTVVRVQQSRQFAKALARHGKHHRYVEQEHGDHFLSLASQRSEFFLEMGSFLSEHLHMN